MPKVQGNQIPLPWFERRDGAPGPPPTFFIIPENTAAFDFIAQETALTDLMIREDA
jgi:hypothetical protein